MFVEATVSAKVERMAKAICGNNERHPALKELAITIAQNQIVLLQIRAARKALFEQRMIDQKLEGLEERVPDLPNNEEWALAFPGLVRDRACPAAKFVQRPDQRSLRRSSHGTSCAMLPASQPVEGFQRTLPELKRLDRYERRATSRRNRAIRLFTAISVCRSSLGIGLRGGKDT
jgi:hypothetical protein